MFATIAAIYLGYLAIMWTGTGAYNIALKTISGALAVWGAGVALIHWGFIIAPLSQ